MVVKQIGGPSSQLTMDQKKSMGLCFKCNEKYFYGHKCGNKVLHALEMEEEEETEEVEREIEEQLVERQMVERGEEEEIVQATLSICTNHTSSHPFKYTKNLRFKGAIDHIPICLLIDSGNTHSFINPTVVQNLNLKTTHSQPMSVRVANGERMESNQVCKGLKFKVQKHDFEYELRVLDTPGYDIILGMDWISEMGPLTIDGKKGCVSRALRANQPISRLRK